MTVDRLRAAVIGLGQVGSRFDEEPGRKAIWTHVGAYLGYNNKFELVAAVEPSEENAAAFARRAPGIPVAASVRQLMDSHAPEIVSICTPPQTHHDIFREIIDAPSVRAVWCEKPFSLDLAAAQSMADCARAKGIPVAVSHNRRWVPLWRRCAAMISENAVGTVRCIRIAMPNRLLSVGSHAIDLGLMLGGPAVAVAPMDIPALQEGGEPARAALIQFASGAYGILQVTGVKDRLVVEAEILGDMGRIHVNEGTGDLNFEAFDPSSKYDNYFELGPTETTQDLTQANFSPFEAIAAELWDVVHGNVEQPSCTTADALAGMEILDYMLAATSSPLALSGGSLGSGANRTLET